MGIQVELKLRTESTNLDKLKVKLLLVDDLNTNLLALEALLERDDLEIFKAKSGDEALEFMISHEFALALLDVNMPGMSGFELAELMRGTNNTKNIPIIFVTATAKEQNFSFKGYETGAVDFLLKPLDAHAVKSKVNIFIKFYLHKKEQEELLTELKNTQAELEQAVRMRDEFMSIASHELKTPLTSLLLQTQLKKRQVQKGDSSAFTPEKLMKIFYDEEKQLIKITHLIDDMLDVSRINSGKLSMTLERFDLCDLVRELIERYSELFLAVGCTVESEFCESALGCWDRFRIEQVVTNILTNAMRYGAGKPILVQVKFSLNKARIIVCDQGRGIAKENQERIFQKFERVLVGNEISGLGIGLYITQQILGAHHGFIRVKSELGQGATFIVELPALEQNEEVRNGL
jgi:signal transduction histidine kinase